MSLVVCAGCTKEYSGNLSKCPHCGHEPNKKMKPCRVCGTQLPVDYHRFSQAFSSWGVANGNSYTSTDYQFLHRPCTNCGEPYPLQNLMDNSLARGSAKLFGLAAGAGVGFAGWILSTMLFKSFGIDWLAGLGGIGVGLASWLYSYLWLRQKIVGY